MRLHGLLIASAILIGAPAIAQDFDFFAFADGDHDGKVTEAEYTAFREGGWNYFFQGQDKVKADASDPMAKHTLAGSTVDAEGNVTHQAYTAAAPDLFKKADTNADGALNADELKATMAPTP